jgi:hypothetical protein
VSEKKIYKLPPDERRCAHVGEDGNRCKAYKARGKELCAGHLGLGFSSSPEAVRMAAARGGRRAAAVRQQLRHEARLLTIMTPRERMVAAMNQRVESGQVMTAIDRGLADPDTRVALQAAGLVLDRAHGRPLQPTEAQLPGTQAYTELRAVVSTLPAEDRLAYLREARMHAGIVTSTPHEGGVVAQGELEPGTEEDPRAQASA